jgi:Ala-tRNA(Pro) deacylase
MSPSSAHSRSASKRSRPCRRRRRQRRLQTQMVGVFVRRAVMQALEATHGSPGRKIAMTTTCKDRLEQHLREQGAAYSIQHHPPAYMARREGAGVTVIADGRSVMAVLPPSYDVLISKLAAALRAREVRLASERGFGSTSPDCELGAMPPFGDLHGHDVYA